MTTPTCSKQDDVIGMCTQIILQYRAIVAKKEK
jgi:hypothetical protein